ncbi:sensor histidine kinase [Mucilaginibacter psychrotolerans]|uniref:histidine kinase n=1 Tax=Mucilaginibacter psychrotolerans TaxID=1524096 RepID=A0A4Y8SP85_9SPHI|nr:ATP-binding protein [Mucilaginibacter psychrotolerans]TFF40206.1 sensor histidine kinase [Mucilaginibacter psychrotolerans]
MPQTDQEVINIVIAGTGMLLLLAVFIIGFLFLYQRRHNKYHMEQEQLKAAFSQELLKTQIEMQEQTLNYVSREIHDNITQVLSFVKLNLAFTANLTDADRTHKIDESRKLVAQAIGDLRDLSKSLSFEHIAQLGLVKTIAIEADRINKSSIMEAVMDVEGQPFSLGDERELVFFRIFQETLNNALKHAGASQFKISMRYDDNAFNLTIADNGAGFDYDALTVGGSGLRNMQNRASLVGAVAKISSSPGKGCYVSIDVNPISKETTIA